MQSKFSYWAAVFAAAAGLAQADPNPKLTPLPQIGSHTGLYWNASEPGWGINVSHQGNIAFGTLFVYGDQGEPRWYVMSNGESTGQGAFDGPLYETRMVGSSVTTEAVGRMRLTFDAAGDGTLQYDVRGRSVTKSIAPQRFAGTPPICHMVSGSRTRATSYQDLWYDAAETGWGLNLAHQAETLFGTLFTYAADGHARWLVMSGATRQADGSWLGTLYRTRGTPFHAATFAPLRPEDVTAAGSIRLRFENGERAQLELVVDGTTRSRTITRQAFAATGPDCSNPAIITALANPTSYSPQPTARLTSPTEGTAVARGTFEVPGFGRGAYQANTGHLTASDSLGTPHASFFHISYSRLNVDPAFRPVVFFWNGGPGSSTSWLHMGSFGPLRLETYAPDSEGRVITLVPNGETLLPVADLVFVDAVGTGFSQAIAPMRNIDFWSVESDAVIFADFIRRYLAANGRTSSPVYVLGESYGGVRTPIVARVLEQAGVRVAGVILQAPILNYNSNCGTAPVSCAGYLPSYTAVAQHHARPVPAPFAGTTAVQMGPVEFRNRLMPGWVIGRYDGRVKAAAGTPGANSGDPSSYYPGVAIQNQLTPLLNSLGYTAAVNYILSGQAIQNWTFAYQGNVRPDAIPDLAVALQLNPSMRVLSMSGLHDLATPWYQTELDAARLAMPARIILRNYNGGHMTYFTETSRHLQHAHLTAFIRGEAVSAESPKSVVEAPSWAALQRGSAPLGTIGELDAYSLGPWVPDDIRMDPRVAPQTRGAELQQQVDRIIGTR